MDFKNQQHISRLIFLYIQGKLPVDQARELQVWRDASASHEELFRRMLSQEHFEDSVRRFVKNSADTEMEWHTIRRRTLEVSHKRSPFYRLFRYAAIFILPLGILLVLYWMGQNKKILLQSPTQVVSITFGGAAAFLELPDGTIVNLQEKASGEVIRCLGREMQVSMDTLKYSGGEKVEDTAYHTLKIPRGGEYSLILADGSKVFLNAESQLRYPIGFSGDSRTVYLEGEAYFEVKKDETKPFVVVVNDMRVKVLGTSFGIRAYTEEAEIRTTLVEGKVNIQAHGQSAGLLPGHQAVFQKQNRSLQVHEVDVDLFVGWKDGRLIFDNVPLEMILKDLARWYSFEVFYANQQVKDIPFSLNVKKHEDFTELLRLLERTGKLKFKLNGNVIVVE